MVKIRTVRAWSAEELVGSLNVYLENGWQLRGEMIVYREARNHAVTGEEYEAPMFMQVIEKEATNDPK